VYASAGFLHYARSRTIEEAIVWHGGEAKAAKTRFVQLPSQGKRELVAWLRQL
jgi:CxxC motif-containing protein (DUF1111 family)